MTNSEINKKYPLVSTRIPLDVFKRLEKRCKQIGEPRSLVVKGMIEASLMICDLSDAVDKAQKKSARMARASKPRKD
jgi:predicted DNA-binding protein